MAAPESNVVPFISHTAGVPSTFCQRMSTLPSPLKSPDPTACHVVPGLEPARPPPVSVVPFISQIAVVPSTFCHKRSELPSPLKSPAAFKCQLVPGLASAAPETKLVPFISQIAAV